MEGTQALIKSGWDWGHYMVLYGGPVLIHTVDKEKSERAKFTQAERARIIYFNQVLHKIHFTGLFQLYLRFTPIGAKKILFL